VLFFVGGRRKGCVPVCVGLFFCLCFFSTALTLTCVFVHFFSVWCMMALVSCFVSSGLSFLFVSCQCLVPVSQAGEQSVVRRVSSGDVVEVGFRSPSLAHPFLFPSVSQRHVFVRRLSVFLCSFLRTPFLIPRVDICT